MVRVNKWSPNAVTICAETQADAISAHSGKDSLTIEARGGYSNEAGETLTGTYARTELSDIVRQMSWQNCNAYMNRTFDDNVFINQMVNLQSGAIDVLMARALHPAGAPDPNKGSTGTVPDATTCKADKTLVGKECKKKVPQAGH